MDCPMDDERTTGVLGLSLDRALERLRALGVLDARVEWIAAPGKPEGRGTPRVVRALDGGNTLTVARFPDEVEMDD